ncbi:MAG: class B sortase [Acetatifactor sp.]|nr:class B sortase [Acetatifactor sp.]
MDMNQTEESTESKLLQEPPAEQPTQRSGKRSAKWKSRRTVVVLAVGAVICAVITGFLLADYYRAGAETSKALEALRMEVQEFRQEKMTIVHPSGLSADQEISVTENPFRTVFQEYPDIKGWLYVEGMLIDYPVLQREGEDEYYLYLNFKGDEDKRGSLILDEDSSVQEGMFSTNLLIHGHNMKDGSMFGELDR